MTSLQISQGTFRQGKHRALYIEQLMLQAGESWAFVGTNGSGKSSLAKAVTGELPVAEGQFCQQFERAVRLSLEQLSQLTAKEWQRSNTDLYSEDECENGRLTRDIIMDEVDDEARCRQLSQQFAIRHLLDRPFKFLSTGETRKALLCKTLMSAPDLLVLDEPFDGLDVESRQILTRQLQALHQQGTSLVLVLNRFEDIPEFIDHVGVLAEGTLSHSGPRKDILQQALIMQLAHSEKITTLELPATDDPATQRRCPADQSPVILRNGKVSWDDKLIINGLNWQVEPGQHWQITGPNGAGKSTLLSLITGDHPQGYSNDLTLFGIRRGSGETIWDIKQHIGYVSSSLHLEYRVSATVRTVILSGFFDSVGLYQSVSDRQNQLASEWLALLGMDNTLANAPFHSLSWGQQRLVLIVRALVKHPRILILDEPLQGLDAINRQLIRQFVTILIREGHTQLLFVSHHAEDAPECITHRLSFVPDGSGGYTYQQSPLPPH
ncbi:MULTISPECIES: molybdate ABC transporter ATP-binding protein ModF [unclassified Tatumella]|uniref:molybdate ABC transporter ATP-binding protein ModF n=1 Tax=unclassified Tatumella TaxID=2649542 RepID=UPI001BAFBEBB|nr:MULTISPECIES: molybdate ABC transporter ATP-binding protein ModF [unclassified Tatumella]MBS0875910.1 molybdate ABC transporter ATP-binding protein ModF [Tatumella sp. JGM82]MBS0890315.1 molybdate ABC transporter ATP-binding protein ModF [Tatumella sp. JGM94]MBS0900441.1 molybdate ABC transporter ATP-binding protein ModF [Tatumella sp. JGM100]